MSLNHLEDGIQAIEQALQQAPWKREWCDNLLKAYELTKQGDKAEALKKRYRLDQKESSEESENTWHDVPDGQMTTGF